MARGALGGDGRLPAGPFQGVEPRAERRDGHARHGPPLRRGGRVRGAPGQRLRPRDRDARHERRQGGILGGEERVQEGLRALDQRHPKEGRRGRARHPRALPRRLGQVGRRPVDHQRRPRSGRPRSRRRPRHRARRRLLRRPRRRRPEGQILPRLDPPERRRLRAPRPRGAEDRPRFRGGPPRGPDAPADAPADVLHRRQHS